MFRKQIFILAVLVLSLAVTVPVQAAQLSSAMTIPGGDVSGIWDLAGSPYLIEGNITIPAGATLTIEPGVEVLFQSWYSLTVNGTLLAEGTENAPILFGGGHPSAGWLGIRFVDAPDGSMITYAIIESGRATGADPLNKGGGIYIDNTSPFISYSTIRNNHAKQSGGGIYLNNSNATLLANTIVNNTAGDGGSASGGGLTILYSDPLVMDNLISGNSVYISGSYTTPSGSGGGLFIRSSTGTFARNLITDNHINAHLNSNARGGGLYIYYGAPIFINNTITGNSVDNDSTGVYAVREGGGVYSYYADPVFVNNILWNDTPQELFVHGSQATFAYSDVQGGLAGIQNENAVINWEPGNIDSDPLFADPVDGDFSLQDTSPAVDAGTAYFEWDGMVIIDLNSEDYNGSSPDMGAFESSYAGEINQPPTAVLSASPENGDAPLIVQFSSDGSYDPDGTITTFVWDFGNGSTSNQANPSYTYTNPGTYLAVLVVTDNDGASSSAAVSIQVTQLNENPLYVHVQDISRVNIGRNFWRGIVTLLVTDQEDQPIPGAVVVVSYSGPNQGELKGETGSDGTVTLYTNRKRNPKGNWCFGIVDASKNGYLFATTPGLDTQVCEVSMPFIIDKDSGS